MTNRKTLPLALAGLGVLILSHQHASAHAVAGNRVFPVTLTMDDPGVADEASIPTFSWQKNGTTENDYGLNFEFDKRVTETFGFAFNWGWNISTFTGAKTQQGFQNLFITAKDQVYVNAPHEFIMSLGVVREVGGTGNTNVGADRFGATQPTIYMGKGLGDLPIGLLRPLAITAEAGYNFVDVRLNSTGDNMGGQNSFAGAVSIQYSIPYLQSQVKDYGFPEFVNRLVPIVEMTWNVPTGGVTTPSPTTFQIAPGVIYLANNWQFGVEALIPGNSATGNHIGVIAQFHLFFDDLFPNTLGKPLVDW